MEEFCKILRHEGVVVRRPEAIDFSKVKLLGSPEFIFFNYNDLFEKFWNYT